MGGNFFGGDAWSNSHTRNMLVEPHRSTRIRGLNDADLTREYFPSDVPMDWYNMSRADISRGSNSILFGLGSPAGLINNTLKTPNMAKNAYALELQVGSYGTFRRMLDLDQTIIPGQLALRVVALDDDARFRQDFTFNRDKRLYTALRWQPKIARGIYTQIDAKAEWGNINANRPVAGTPSDFLSSWFGGANRLEIPNDEYWTAPGFVEDLYASQTIGGQLWDNHPVSFFGDVGSGAVGMTDAVDAMLLRGNHNVNGGGWGSWVGLINPNWVGHAANPKNSAAYYADNATVAPILAAYEQSTGRTFRGFGNGMWPVQMIVDGPLAELMHNQNLIGPNKSEFNNFRNINLAFTQSYLDGRLGLNFAFDKQHYSSGYTNLMEGLWGMNMISVDVNRTLRGTTTPNPNFGRPFTIGEGRGGIYEKDRENWRATVFGVLKATDFLRKSWLTDILGEHTFTGVRASQHFENFDRSYALYRWDQDYLSVVDGRTSANPAYATWRGIHYLGDSILDTASMDAVTGVTGVRTRQIPTATQSVWHDNQGTWTTGNFSLLSAEDSIDRLYDGVGQGYDDTQSKVFVWQGKMLNNVLVPIFGWREDSYTRWNKPSAPARDATYNFVLPDVVLMDLRMPGIGGVEAILAIRNKHPEARVIVLSTYDTDEDIHRALQSGAKSYLLKDMPIEEIASTIRSVFEGDASLPRSVAERLTERALRQQLTERERDVLEALIKGRSNKEISASLCISEDTVKSHLKTLFAKLRVRDRTGAAVEAIRHGIVHLK